MTGGGVGADCPVHIGRLHRPHNTNVGSPNNSHRAVFPQSLAAHKNCKRHSHQPLVFSCVTTADNAYPSLIWTDVTYHNPCLRRRPSRSRRLPSYIKSGAADIDDGVFVGAQHWCSRHRRRCLRRSATGDGAAGIDDGVFVRECWRVSGNVGASLIVSIIDRCHRWRWWSIVVVVVVDGGRSRLIVIIIVVDGRSLANSMLTVDGAWQVIGRCGRCRGMCRCQSSSSLLFMK